jgi:hypothetical protein
MQKSNPNILIFWNLYTRFIGSHWRAPGLKWEFDRIFETGRLAKTVFVVWSPDGGWLGGPWTELLERTGGGDLAPVTEKPGNKIALAATCANDDIRIAAASAHTPLNCGLAVSDVAIPVDGGREGN